MRFSFHFANRASHIPGAKSRLLTQVSKCAVSLLLTLAALSFASAQTITTNETQTKIIALKSEMEQAMTRVRQIVNQPVTRYARRPGMQVGEFTPGWFHEGASKPDFNTVDVRTTQELIYDKYKYVTSDLNPGVVFLSSQLEFNSMTKYFYADRTVPKKRLTEAEMLEINRLYRIIGRCERELSQLVNPPIEDGTNAVETESAPAEQKPFLQRIPRENFIKGGIVIAALFVLYCGYRLVRK